MEHALTIVVTLAAGLALGYVLGYWGVGRLLRRRPRLPYGPDGREGWEP